MQHIIWITPGFAANEEDTKCIPPQQLLAKALTKVPSVRLHIVSLHYPHQRAEYHWHGVDVYPCHYQGPLAKVRTWLKAYHQIRLLTKAYPKAILHSFWLNDACLLAQWVDRFRGRKHLVTLMGQDARPTNRYLRILPLKDMYKVGLSQFHVKQFLQSTGFEVDQIIPWGLPQPSIKQGARPNHLIGIGNLIPLKQFDQFVDLVVALRKDIPDLTCLLVGEGPEKEHLESKIAASGLSNHITLTGALPREKVLNLLAQSKVLVHTSDYESFGFVLVEALQQGAHVVSRPVGVAPELNGVSLAQTTVEFKHAVLEALQSEQEPNLPPSFQLDSTIDSYLKLYSSLQSPS